MPIDGPDKSHNKPKFNTAVSPGPEQISGSSIVKFRQGLCAVGRAAAWHSLQALGKGWLLMMAFLIVFLFLLCFFFFSLFLYFFLKPFLSICIASFSSAPLLPSHPVSVLHHLPSNSPSPFSLSLFYPSPSKKGNRNPKEEQELNQCQCNGPRGYIWNQQITEP